MMSTSLSLKRPARRSEDDVVDARIRAEGIG